MTAKTDWVGGNTVTPAALNLLGTEINNAYSPGDTDVAVVDGGTGGSTAAVARTNLAAERAFQFNVKDYGALGNDSADDTAAINSAIAACVTAGGGTVFFPVSAPYRHTGLVLPITGNVTVRLKGGHILNSVLKNTHPTNASITVHGAGSDFGLGTGLEDLTLTTTATTLGGVVATQAALDVAALASFKFSRVAFNNHGIGVKHGIVWAGIYSDLQFFQCGIAFQMIGGVNASTPLVLQDVNIYNCGTGYDLHNPCGMAVFGGGVTNCNTGVILGNYGGTSFYGVVFEANTGDDIAQSTTGGDIPVDYQFYSCVFLNHTDKARSVYHQVQTLTFENCRWWSTAGTLTTAIEQTNGAGTLRLIAPNFSSGITNRLLRTSEGAVTIPFDTTVVTSVGYTPSGYSLLGSGGVAVSGSSITTGFIDATAASVTEVDPASSSVVAQRTLTGLQTWIGWLDANSAKGAVTEMGWPSVDIPVPTTRVGQNAAHWNPIADAYLKICDDNDIPTAQWSDTNQSDGTTNWMTPIPGWFTGPSTNLAPGTNPTLGPGSIPTIRHAGRGLHGFHSGSGMQGSIPARIGFGAHVTDAANPGYIVYDTSVYATQAYFNLIAASGVQIVRHEFCWEGYQTALGSALNQTMMNKLDAGLQLIANAGMKAIIDCKNYAGFQFWRYGTTTATALGTSVAVGGTIPFNSSDPNLSYSGFAVFPSTGSFDIQIVATGQIISVHRSGSNLIIDAFYNGATSATWSNGTAIRTYRWRLGDGILTGAHLADLWGKISAYYAQPGKAALRAAIYGFELMNEPTAMQTNLATLTTTTVGTGTNVVTGGTITVTSTAGFPGSGSFGVWLNNISIAVHVGSSTTFIIDSQGSYTWTNGQVINSPQRVWENATQQCVTAIRANDTTACIFIPGYDFASITGWKRSHPQAWITDPNNNIRYAAHHYWSTNNASYDITWDVEESGLTYPSNSGGYVMIDGNPKGRLNGTTNRLRPQVGQATLDRMSARDALTIMTSGTAYCTLFVGEADQTVTTVAAAVAVAGSTDATVSRFAVIEVNTIRQLTILATTTHDATLFGTLTSGMTAAKTLSTPVKLRRGMLYAVVALTVGGTTKPTLQGCKGIPDFARWPQPALTRTGLTDLWTGTATPTSSFGEAFYAVMA